ncbi:Splicing factor motif [Ostreococcus tauri]|uniref:Pre-mRNA-splicing factor 18 n=1 Tax=Ostreococcus tauri TaxID=70448 RepID=Q01FS2_OSTTA|nr:Splicing factor motif [Ostreococcus tauri]CAL50422.1 Splicing factor motif [Ostreococcus tauri]|eukprot:XP_003074571.1 Splicing factor motif [Ostreococcus tauri]
MEATTAEITRMRAERASRARERGAVRWFARASDGGATPTAGEVGEKRARDDDADDGRARAGAETRAGDGPHAIARVLDDAAADAAMDALDAEETIRRLRRLGQPATMFGETREDRILRLKVATKNIVIEDEATTTATQANEKVLDDERVEAFARRKKEQSTKKAMTSAGGEAAMEMTEEEAKMAEEQALMDAFAQAAKKVKKQREAENAEPIDQVAMYFKSLVAEWGAELEAKPEEWAYTHEGRQGISTFETLKQHLKPLFKRIKKRTIPVDVERALYLIMQSMKQRNYKKAADAYVGIAIGNAAWPIGVTMVGIHARSAREKIGASSQAHAMHDEETRKYLQSVKRLMTFAQRAYPTTPSLSLDFNSGINGSDKAELLKAEARLGSIDKAVPALMLGNGREPGSSAKVDGWRAQDSDTRTWKSMLTHAYGEKGRNAVITTAKDEVIAKDTSLMSTRSGYVAADKRKPATRD